MTAIKRTMWQKVVDAILYAMDAGFAEQEARIDALEASIKDFTYRGTWEDGTVYRRSNSATDHGSLWICTALSSMQRPGEGPDWKLAVKRSRDGRDARS